ncbi:MAG: prepilin-type N-terminal cleavage/methylation domain-containing protein [Ramlibacter sp.]|nr:prepilin-type N-terminal cleavage/methylation domain-containing protein [Ramlibacter sp.]
MDGASTVKGFTLLEMLFVLFIVGLLVSLTVPRYAGNLRQRELATERQTVETRLIVLPRRARLAGVNLKFPDDLGKAELGDGAPVLDVPPGWVLRFTPEWQVTMNSTCSTSTIELTRKDDPALLYRYRVLEPNCDLTPVVN